MTTTLEKIKNLLLSKEENKTKLYAEMILDDEEVVNKMNEMAEKEMQNKSPDKEDKKDNEVINNMLQYFKERFENGRE